jgi:hypothetical protein
VLAHLGTDFKVRIMTFDALSWAWSASHVATDASNQPIYGWTTPGLAVHDGQVVMGVLQLDAFVGKLRVFKRIDPSSLEVLRRWQLVSTARDFGLSPVQPISTSVVSAPSIYAKGRNDLYLYHGGPFGNLDWIATTDSTMTAWTPPGGHTGQAIETGAAVVYDARSGALPGVRLFRTMIGAGQTPSGESLGFLILAPFAQGVDPALYGDYDDWTGLQYGFCKKLSDLAPLFAPAGTDAYNPTSYRTGHDCGDEPRYPEP